MSSGQKERETPAGVFSVMQQDADHHSNQYDDAFMPDMQQLTWSGSALHAHLDIRRPMDAFACPSTSQNACSHDRRLRECLRSNHLASKEAKWSVAIELRRSSI